MMIAGIGIEIAPLGINNDFTQQSGLRKLMQRIVNSGQRDANFGVLNFCMEQFCRHMPVATFKQYFGKRNALSGRAKTSLAELANDVTVRSLHIHGHYMAPV